MAYSITDRCISCDSCLPQCPTGAIKIDGEEYWIDPILCNGCQGYYPDPQCVVSCPVASAIPLQPKRGRYKADARTATSPDLFVDNKSNPFASAIVVWEAVSILTQRRSLPWQEENGKLQYQRQVNRGQGRLTFFVTDRLDPDEPVALSDSNASALIDTFDIRAACLHLIYAAHATALNRPWMEEFTINDRQIEEYLGLEKRKDLSKPAKLALIRELALQPCKILTSIDWQPQGRVTGFAVEESRIWHLQEMQYHFQKDDLGCKHLIGITFRIKAGLWTKYFLNQEGYQKRISFYQYGILPKSLLNSVMSLWQQHEGAVRIMLWLLFKSKIGKEQRITTPTLMRIAYGEEKVAQASSQREGRKRLLKTYESDLEILNHYGLKPIFDPVTYPSEIQPLWAKLTDLPDDAEAALEFWMNDGSNETRLTDAAPRGKWNRLMNARFLRFEVPSDWQPSTAKSVEPKRRNRNYRKSIPKVQITLSSEQIIAARKQLQLSQRALADQIGKSQSWVRDIESGRLQASPKDQSLLRKVLGIIQ